MKRGPPRSTRPDTLFPSTTLCRSVISGNRASMARFGEILPAATASSLVERQREQAKCHAELLDARARQGRVRHAHGDLHLANIAVIDDEPVLFDCLEFDPTLAT